jgi:hypothetical protein
MDAVIAGLYHLFALTVPAGDALYWAGATASPLIHLLSVVTTIAVLRTRFSEETLQTLILVLILMPVFIIQFRLGRPDHHGLQIGLMSVLLALTLRIVLELELSRDHLRHWAWSLGGTAALLTWSVAGGLLPVIAVLGALGLLWVVRGGAYAGVGLHAAAAAALGTAIMLPLERGSVLSVLEADRLSLVHIFILTLAAVVFAGARALECVLESASRQPRARTAIRWGFAAIAAGVGLVVLTVLVPKLIFTSKIFEVDALYRHTRSGIIIEGQPILTLGTVSLSDLFRSIGKIIQSAGLLLIAPFAVPVALFRRPSCWPYLLPPLAVVAAYMVFYRDNHFGLISKNAAYMSVPLIFVYAGLVGDATARIRRIVRVERMFLATGIKIAAAGWPWVLSVVLLALAANFPDKTSAQHSCNISQITRELNTLAAKTRPNARVLAVPEVSSMLLHQTDFRVLAIPTHRRQPGYQIMIDIFSETDPARARALMHDHDISGLVTCSRYDVYFGDRENHLYARLARGGTPSGFKRLSALDSPIQVHLRTTYTRNTQQ